MAEPQPRNWRQYALCLGQTSDFFPDTSDELGIARARTVCFQCSVRLECQAAAEGETQGIWGGELLDVKPRRRSKRECPRCFGQELFRMDGYIECVSCGFRWMG